MLRSIDFFRKIQTDQQLTSTTGGIFTIVALSVAGLLIFFSLQDFYQEKYYTFLAIRNDDSEYLPMKIDVLFTKLPCQALALEFRDQLEYVETGLEKKLEMYIVNPGGEEIPYKREGDRQVQRQNLQSNMINHSQCRAKGSISLPKTPGTLTFSANANENLLFETSHDLLSQTRMSYRLSSLSFGTGNGTFDFPIAHKSKNIENYIKYLDGDFNSRQFVQDLSSEGDRLNYFNHLKIIPVVLEQSGNKTAVENYRYSLRAGNVRSGEPTQRVMFMTQIQPINIVYRRHDAAAYDLVRQLLAIVGGTVATIGIFNSISHFLFGIK